MLNSDKIMAPEDPHMIDDDKVEGSFGTYPLSDIEIKLKECSERERHLHRKNEELVELLSEVYEALTNAVGLGDKLLGMRSKIQQVIITDGVRRYLEALPPAKILRKAPRK